MLYKRCSWLKFNILSLFIGLDVFTFWNVSVRSPFRESKKLNKKLQVFFMDFNILILTFVHSEDTECNPMCRWEGEEVSL